MILKENASFELSIEDFKYNKVRFVGFLCFFVNIDERCVLFQLKRHRRKKYIKSVMFYRQVKGKLPPSGSLEQKGYSELY